MALMTCCEFFNTWMTHERLNCRVAKEWDLVHTNLGLEVSDLNKTISVCIFLPVKKVCLLHMQNGCSE